MPNVVESECSSSIDVERGNHHEDNGDVVVLMLMLI